MAAEPDSTEALFNDSENYRDRPALVDQPTDARLFLALRDNAEYMTDCGHNPPDTESCTMCRLKFVTELTRQELLAQGGFPTDADEAPVRFGTAACVETEVEA